MLSLTRFLFKAHRHQDTLTVVVTCFVKNQFPPMRFFFEGVVMFRRALFIIIIIIIKINLN